MWVKIDTHEFVFAVRMQFDPGSQVVRLQAVDGRWFRLVGDQAVQMRAVLEKAAVSPAITPSLVA